MSFSENPPLPSTDWDILISGSGTLQSLLAVALGRAGKTVLQIDRNNYYGGSSTAFYSGADIESWVRSVNDGREPGFSGAVVTGEVGRGYTMSLAPELVYWHSGLLRLLRGADMTDSFSWQAVGGWWVWATDDDIAVPAAVAGGSAAAVSAGVKAARVVAGAKRKWNKGRKKETGEVKEDGAVEGVGDGATTLRRIGDFREVPCTFEDVAWSKDLTDSDRGYLGEFLRFVMKHDSLDPADQKYRDMFQANRTTSLHDFLSTTYPLPPSAITSLSSLTLLPSPPTAIPLETALPRLSTHFTSLGNIPDVRSAAALTIAYGGSAELCQVFSRAAAVAGGVNVLGRGIRNISKADGETKRRHQVELDNGETIQVDWVIGEEEELGLREDARQPATQTAKAAYVIDGEMKALFEKKYKDEVIMPAAVVVMAPAVGEGGKPVYVLARSAITGECPRGQCLLYASTTDPSGYDAITAAVNRLLESQADPPKILFSLKYTVTSYQPRNRGEGQAGIIKLDPVGAGVVFDDGVVEKARGIWEGVVGMKDGFMNLPEEARRLMDEMEE